MNTPEERKPSEEERDLPKFVVIEEQHHYEGASFELPQFSKKPPKQSFKMCVICFLLFLVGVLWAFGAFVCTLFMGCFSLVTFFQIPLINSIVKMYWMWTKGGIVVALGFLIALFNLILGIIFILTYFSLVGENWQSGVFRQRFYPYFKDYL